MCAHHRKSSFHFEGGTLLVGVLISNFFSYPGVLIRAEAATLLWMAVPSFTVIPLHRIVLAYLFALTSIFNSTTGNKSSNSNFKNFKGIKVAQKTNIFVKPSLKRDRLHTSFYVISKKQTSFLS